MPSGMTLEQVLKVMAAPEPAPEPEPEPEIEPEPKKAKSGKLNQ